MDRFRRRSSTEESFGRLERALSGLTIPRKSSLQAEPTDSERYKASDQEDFKGPLGLNLLHNVPEPLVDFIFIHGLGGGSRKTWSKSPDPYHFWPKEWISRDPEFNCVRVHSYGYKADWAERKSSFLNVHDFSLALLGEIQCNPDIRRSNTKLVLVSHSMGGIVTKKAYILAREDPTLKELASRIHTLYFLATPHRGADLAKTLHNIVRISFGPKQFVLDLERNSDAVQSINDSFRYFAEDLQLWSFYETLPCKLPFTNTVIVDKASATLGLPKERCSLLNADHRGICKFGSPTDSDYKTLRNAFITTVDSITTEISHKVSDATKSEYSSLITLTGISEAPVDDLLALEELRIPGSCAWLTLKDPYMKWKSTWSFSQPIFWLTGDAGCGKSVLSSYVISDLEESNMKCSYFYFKHGTATKSSITGCLLSLAFQMGQSDGTTLARICELAGGSETWEHLDERTLWRKVFLGSIFKESNPEPHYWVIDALDECRRLPVLISLLARAPPYLRVFITSRNTPEVHQILASHGAVVEHYAIQEQDTLTDLKIYVNSRTGFLPASPSDGQRSLRSKILERANGSFLWTSLVVRELEGVFSEEAAEEVLNEVPEDMNGLYTQMLMNIQPKGLKLARSVFTWTLLAMRPLSLGELKLAVKSDTGETVHHLASVIMAICGQLIRVSPNDQVQCIHQSAKTFLLQQDTVPSLAISKAKGHSRLAELCLRCLNMAFSKRLGRKRTTPSSLTASDADLADYAAVHFSDHLQRCGSENSQLWDLLAEFLEDNIFVWIEYLATTARLQYLTSTAKNLKSYLLRRMKHIQPFCNKRDTLEAWIHDLIRLNAKFRTHLRICPSSIHNVIPAFCPSGTIVARTYAARPRGILIKGLEDKAWDECLARIDYPHGQTSAVSHSDRYLAVAVSKGTIYVYLRDATIPNATLFHGEPVEILVLSNDDTYLASSGQAKVRVWDVQTSTQTWSFDLRHQPLALAFIHDSTFLVAATQGNYTVSWDLQGDCSEEETWSWITSFQETTGHAKPAQQPRKAHMSDDCLVLAVSYRGKPIYLFDLRAESLIGSCSRSAANAKQGEYIVDALVFNPNPEIDVLVASYGDGGLAVFDQWTAETHYILDDVFAHTLACSPDGRMLITGSASGEIQIFEFAGAKGANLTPVYRVNAFDDGVYGVAFSSDARRFADIRRSQCRIWEPSVLISEEYDEGSQSELSQAITLKPRSVGMIEEPQEAEISSVCHHPSRGYVFCGTDDGTVTYFDSRSASQGQILYRHASNIRITAITYSENGGLLVTADESSRVIISTIACKRTRCEVLATLADIHSGISVLGLVVNTAGTRLLIWGRSSIHFWTTSGRHIPSHVKLDDLGDACTFMNHPLDSQSFLTVRPGHTTVHPWDNQPVEGCLEVIDEDNTTDQIAQHMGLSLSSTKVSSVGHKVSNKYIASMSKPVFGPGQSPDPKLQLWDMSKLAPDQLHLEKMPLPGLDAISRHMRQIVCVSGNLLLFLDHDLWMCSVDIARWAADKGGAQRHFFLLPEWKGSSRDFLVEYVALEREFVVVRKHGILVIRRGLDVAVPLDVS